MIEPGQNEHRSGSVARDAPRQVASRKTGIHLTWILPPRHLSPVRHRAPGGGAAKTLPHLRISNNAGVNRRGSKCESTLRVAFTPRCSMAGSAGASASHGSALLPIGPGIRPCDEAAVSLYAVRRDLVCGLAAAPQDLPMSPPRSGRPPPVAVHRVAGQAGETQDFASGPFLGWYSGISGKLRAGGSPRIDDSPVAEGYRVEIGARKRAPPSPKTGRRSLLAVREAWRSRGR